MPGFNPEKINIHELAIEEPEKQVEIPFDPEKDITEDQWSAIDSIINRNRKDYASVSGWGAVSALGLDSTLLGRPIEFDDEDWKYIEKSKKICGSRKNEDRKFSDMAALQALYGKSDLSITDKAEIGSYLERIRTASWGNANIIVKQAILGMLTPASPQEIQRAEQDMQRARKVDKWNIFAQMAASARLLGVEVPISAEEWKQIRSEREKVWEERGEPMLLLDMVIPEAILAADEIRIPKDGGLEIIYHRQPEEKLFQETPQMPEQKQF